MNRLPVAVLAIVMLMVGACSASVGDSAQVWGNVIVDPLAGPDGGELATSDSHCTCHNGGRLSIVGSYGWPSPDYVARYEVPASRPFDSSACGDGGFVRVCDYTWDKLVETDRIMRSVVPQKPAGASQPAEKE